MLILWYMVSDRLPLKPVVVPNGKPRDEGWLPGHHCRRSEEECAERTLRGGLVTVWALRPAVAVFPKDGPQGSS